ncbi:MAG: flagellar hook-basal body complex protein FliE [Planctomycetota bacterium]
MADPLGLVGGVSGAGGTHGVRAPGQMGPVGDGPPEGPSFRDVLMENLARVNELQQDATAAIEDLASGERDDLEQVLMATQKADTAFRMLQQVRNKLVEAYREVQQIRV